MCSCAGTTCRWTVKTASGGSRARRRRRHAHVRRARGARHPLPRGAGEVGAEPVPAAVADAVPLDGQSVPGMFHACKFCFARPTHTYLDLDAGRDFEREIVVKVNVPEVLRAELARPSWKREQVALGHEHRPLPVGREPLQADAGDLAGAARHRHALLAGHASRRSRCATSTSSRSWPPGPGVSVYFSVPTLDERAWRETEPHTPSPRARLEAVRKMNEAGVPAGILIAPLMPGINDSPEQVGEILRHRRGRRRDQRRLACALHLRGEVQAHLLRLAAHAPARPDPALRGALQRRRLRRRARSASGSQSWSTSVRPRGDRAAQAARGRRRGRRGSARDAAQAPEPASRAAQPLLVRRSPPRPAARSALRHSHMLHHVLGDRAARGTRRRSAPAGGRAGTSRCRTAPSP